MSQTVISWFLPWWKHPGGQSEDSPESTMAGIRGAESARQRGCQALTRGPSSRHQAAEGCGEVGGGQGRDGGLKGTKSRLVQLQNRLTLNPQSPFHSLRQAHFHSDGSSRTLSAGPAPGQSQLFPASCFMSTVTRSAITKP